MGFCGCRPWACYKSGCSYSAADLGQTVPSISREQIHRSLITILSTCCVCVCVCVCVTKRETLCVSGWGVRETETAHAVSVSIMGLYIAIVLINVHSNY